MRRPGLHGGILVLVALLVFSLPVMAHAAAACGSGRTAGALTIDHPLPGAAVDLAVTPQFTVDGTVRAFAFGASRVDLYADGRLVASTRLAGSLLQANTKWSLQTSAPAGTHVLTACAVNVLLGTVARAERTITVSVPPADATVLAPEVVPLSPTDTAAITAKDEGSVTFAGRPTFRVGQILMASETATTPEGMRRRITAIEPTGVGTVFRTVRAAIDEAFLQAEFKVEGAPLEPVPDPAVSADTLRPAAVSVGLPEVSFSKAFSISAGSIGDWRGSGSVGGSVSWKFAAFLDFDLKIGISWSWGIPKPVIERFLVRITGDSTNETTIEAKGALSGKVTLAETPKLVRAVIGPLVIVPALKFDLVGSFSLGGTLKVERLRSISHVSVGGELRDGRFNPFAVRDLRYDSGTVTDDLPPGAQVKEALKFGLKPAFELKENEIVTETIGLEAGVKFEGNQSIGTGFPCPGSFTGSFYLDLVISLSVEIFKFTLIEVTSVPGSWSVTFLKRPWFSCAVDPTVTSTTLPDAVFDREYEHGLSAAGGLPEYRWALESGSLPAGLNLQQNGHITGSPGTPGMSTFTVRVTDSAGKSATGPVTLKVVVETLAVATETLPIAFADFAYSDDLVPDGGVGPYIWTLLAGALPAGITLDPSGTISGTTQVVGPVTFTVQVADSAGATATRELTLDVSDELPPPVFGGGWTNPADLLPRAKGAGSYGDPHIVTFDGADYDFQQVGEYILAESTTDDLEIQARQSALGSRVMSLNTGVAMRVAGHRVGIYSGGRLLVDGVEQPAGTDPIALPGGGTILRQVYYQTVVWPDGTFVSVRGFGNTVLNLSLGIPESRLGRLHGLLGDADNEPGNDVVTRAGAVLDQPVSEETLYGDFSHSWRISDAESLFDYGAGESTATFTDTAFPHTILRLEHLPAANREAAENVCRDAGVEEGHFLDACILDVVLTGDSNFVSGALGAQKLDDAPSGGALPDGDFESPELASSQNSLSVGARIGEWTVTRGSVDHVRDDFWQAASGHQSIDLNGCSPGRIAQTVQLEPGRRYSLGLSLAGNPASPFGTKSVSAEINGTLLEAFSFDTRGKSARAMGWQRAVTTFVAPSAAVEIAFASGTRGCYGPTLDQVTLTALTTPAAVVAASMPGDRWSSPLFGSGPAKLSYGHAGCRELDDLLRCIGGTWPVIDDAAWVWVQRPAQVLPGTATFTREVTFSPGQVANGLVLTVAGDDSFAAEVDGRQVLTGASGVPSSVQVSLSPGTHTLRFTVRNNFKLDAQNNPGGLAWKLASR